MHSWRVRSDERKDVGRKIGAMVIGLLHPTPINEHLLCVSHSSG